MCKLLNHFCLFRLAAGKVTRANFRHNPRTAPTPDYRDTLSAGEVLSAPIADQQLLHWYNLKPANEVSKVGSEFGAKLRRISRHFRGWLSHIVSSAIHARPAWSG
jgi:hypothetical protein